ncbi:hypothetical protein GOODEAATRI_008727 [Goodea atripinnis]|uniref:Uncharacterized protein n=1 Tax=Goodea atripinnis TaxID=208336 RepID=A0ABV0MI61_9TELE
MRCEFTHCYDPFSLLCRFISTFNRRMTDALLCLHDIRGSQLAILCYSFPHLFGDRNGNQNKHSTVSSGCIQQEMYELQQLPVITPGEPLQPPCEFQTEIHHLKKCLEQ